MAEVAGKLLDSDVALEHAATAGEAVCRPSRLLLSSFFPAAFLIPTLLYGSELWAVSHYQFAYLLVPAALSLAVGGIRSQQGLQPGTARTAWQWWAPAGVLALLGTVSATAWLGAMGMLLWIAGAIYAVGGRALLKVVAPSWCCLWLTIRPPGDLDLRLIQALQSVTAGLADRFLDQLGQVHMLTGNAITVVGKKLFVEEACSGIQSLFAGWACAWLLCLARRHGLLRSTLLLASVPLWAITANVARVVLISVLWNEQRISVDQGFRHDALGMVLFAMVVGLIASTDCLLGWIFAAGELRVRHICLRHPHDLRVLPLSERRSWPAVSTVLFQSRAAGICGAGLLLLQLAFFVGGDRLLGDGRAALQLPQFGAAVLPARIGDWRHVGYEAVRRPNSSGDGTHGQLWHFEGPDGKATVAIDYPFTGWHELSICYPADGWELCSRNVATTPLPAASGTTVLTTAAYRREPEGVDGLLFFDLFDTAGKPVYDSGDPLSITTRLKRRLLRWQDRVWGPRTTIQIQVFLESPAESESSPAAERAVADRRRRTAQELFDAARAPLTAACVEAAKRGDL
jgi:exosortase